MKKSIAYTISSICLLCLISCQNTAKTADLENLNGYWEIKKVESPYGDDRDYQFSETVDYIEIDSLNHGIRKKMKASISGKYKTTPRVERFEIKEKNDSLRFFYNTQMDDWKETLLRLDKDEFAVRNPRGIIYTYKRFKGFLDNEE